MFINGTYNSSVTSHLSTPNSAVNAVTSVMWHSGGTKVNTALPNSGDSWSLVIRCTLSLVNL